MCGIAGMTGPEWNDVTISRMKATMERRGPDGNGVYAGENALLLHSRLAIIDPAGGVQPMKLAWAGERYVLVYNGELYNTRELRRELEGKGHRFWGHSDTEVVLHAYAEYGAPCLHKFNGIFAFAVWEENRKRLFLARDRIGVKPLFFREGPEGLIFASEMKTILACPGVRARLDREGAAQLLLLGPGRLPGSGVFQGIRELEPGQYGCYEAGKLKLSQYWKLRDREHTDSFGETCERVRFLVTDAIRRQLVSDVPIGTFLSGGLDSSVITAVCAGEKPNLPTFSVDYADQAKYFLPGKFQPDSDGEYIRLMQEWLNTDHHWTVLDPVELADTLEAAVDARDLPGMGDVDSSLLAFCKRIRPWVKVALSGECADEIFGGYPWYRDPEIRSRAGFPWAQNTAKRAELLLPGIVKEPEEFVMEAYRATLRESDILPGTPPEERRMKEMVNLNFRHFMQTLLDRKDRMSMHSSLEVRVPFCDWRIAEYLYGVPWEMKDHRGKEKGLLRTAMEGILPEAVLWRKKSPYPKTFHPAYAQMVEQRLRERLTHRDDPLFGLISGKRLEAYLRQDTPWPWYGQLMVRPQTMAYFLQLDYWLRKYRVEFCF